MTGPMKLLRIVPVLCVFIPAFSAPLSPPPLHGIVLVLSVAAYYLYVSRLGVDWISSHIAVILGVIFTVLFARPELEAHPIDPDYWRVVWEPGPWNWICLATAGTYILHSFIAVMHLEREC